tara:strand:+ start:2817 stop:3083 length:267 start_codon:yes stop_codon:yes gene_type:complete
MAEEQTTEYQNDLGIIEQQLNILVQQKTEKINEIKEIDTRLGQLQGAAAYVRGKLNPQQVEEPEEVTTQKDEIPIEVHEKAKEFIGKK